MPVVLSAAVVGTGNPPALLTPADANTMSCQGGLTVTFQYDPAKSGNTPTGWFFERQILGVGVWQWWDAALGEWSTVAVENAWEDPSNDVQTVTFPAGAWPDQQVYAWSAATVDANGQTNYAEAFTINAVGAVGASVTAPVGSQAYSDPTIAWAASWPPAYQQAAYRLVVETGTPSGATAPGGGTPVLDTGITAGTAQSGQPAVAFDEGVLHTVWAQLYGTDSLQSEWASAQFTPSYTPPPAPTLTAEATTWPSTGHPCVDLTAAFDLSAASPDVATAKAAVVFQFSDDDTNWYAVRNGQTNFDLSQTGSASGTATATDHEVRPGVLRYYRAALYYYPDPPGSPWQNVLVSTSAVAEAQTSTLKWWLKHLTDPNLSVGFNLQPGTSLSLTRVAPQTVNDVIGRSDPIVLMDVLQLPAITLPMRFMDDPTYQRFLQLRETQDVYKLEGPYPAGSWYVYLGETTQDDTNVKSILFGNGAVVRDVSLAAQAVAAAGEGYTIGTSGSN